MQFLRLFSISNAVGVKRNQNGYNLATTGMLPNFGKPAAKAGATTRADRRPLPQLLSPVSTVLDSVFGILKKVAAAAKRVLLKPEQPFAEPEQKKSYQVFRRLTAHDEVRHVAPPATNRSAPTADAFTDNQELGKQIKPTLWQKLSKGWRRELPYSGEPASSHSSTALPIDVPEAEAPARDVNVFAATCPGRPEKNLIADGFEKRMAEKKTAAPVVAKVAPAAVHSAAKAEVKQSLPSRLREMFGRKRKVAQPAVQGEFALDNVRPIRNDLSDADLEVVSAVAKGGTGNTHTATAEKAHSTALSRRAPKKTDSAISSAADVPQAEPTPELIARV